jgi:hypothetical protein
MLLPLLLIIAGATLTAGFRILKQFKGYSTHYGKQVHFQVLDSTANVILDVNWLKRKTFSTEYSAVHVPVRVVLPDIAELCNQWCGEHFNENRLHPYHLQKVQHLQPGDPARRLDFCNWLNENRHLYRYILFSDEAQFTRDGINNTRNSHVSAELNPHPTMETNFQHHFSINLWCDVLHYQLIDSFVFPRCLTGAVYLQFLQEELLQLLEDVPLAVRYRMMYQHDGAHPHFNRAVVEHLNVHFPERWVGQGSMHPCA